MWRALGRGEVGAATIQPRGPGARSTAVAHRPSANDRATPLNGRNREKMKFENDPRTQPAALKALELIDYVKGLMDQQRLVEAAAAARVSWLTDPSMTVLPRDTVCVLQMHVDSAWVALSAGDVRAASEALKRAQRTVGG